MKKSSRLLRPPPSGILPIIHSIRILHKDIYCISGKLSKRDKLGIHSHVETLCLEVLSFSVESAFKSKEQKMSSLEKLRLKIEVLKHIIRTEKELGIVDDKTYIRLAEQLVEISKMTNGWIRSLTQKELPTR